MALPCNRTAVTRILAEISDRIIGQKRNGFSCSCGAVHCGPATAVSIKPGGDSYPGQETIISCWSVNMRYHPEDPSSRDGYGFGLSEFIPCAELTEIFERHFSGIEQTGNIWRLLVSGSDRVEQGLAPVIRIRNNAKLIEFTIDWGRDQQTAKLFEKRVSALRSSNGVGSYSFNDILLKLSKVRAIPYLGGPAPELAYESEWLVDFDVALTIARDCEEVIVGSGLFVDHSGIYIPGTSIVFLKHL